MEACCFAPAPEDFRGFWVTSSGALGLHGPIHIWVAVKELIESHHNVDGWSII